jgi:hypothetical protein
MRPGQLKSLSIDQPPDSIKEPAAAVRRERNTHEVPSRAPL